MRPAALSLLVLLLTTVPSAAAEEAWTPLSDDLRVRPLAENLWLHESDSLWGSSVVPANGLIVRGADGAFVVDTPWTDEQTAQLLDWIEEALAVPVLGVVATHFHPDALGGITEVHRRGLASWGHTSTGELAAAEQRAAPKHTVEDRVTLTTGSEDLELVYLGPSHARDLIVARLPSRRVLYGGCAVKALNWTSLGFIGDADLAGWPKALSAMVAFEPETVIPGHGALGGSELLTHTLELLENQARGAGVQSSQ